MIEEKKNNLNYIRLFAGIGVVMLHLINQGGILNNILDRKVAYPIITLIYGLFFTCINLFGFLSGYLLYNFPHSKPFIALSYFGKIPVIQEITF